jgi:hypothetical protein
LSHAVTDKVIIVFKNQVTSVPDTPADAAARTAAVRSAQSGVLAQLAATHARNVKSVSLVNAIAATVSPAAAHSLAANSAVREVIPDLPIPVAANPPVRPATRTSAGLKPLRNACTPRNKVQLDPEAIENIHAATQSGTGDSAQALGYTGAGVKVGFIADGLDINNQDFIRANGKHVFVDYQDFSGTGTNAPTDGAEAFLDASSIAAQGLHVYNVASYGVGLSAPCKIRIRGVAPGASLVGLNVFGSANVAFNSVFLEAINYAVTVDHVNVLNESFGSNMFPDVASLDLTKMADDAAVKAGVTVTVSSGDAGVTDTIGSPASDPHLISAGATTTYRAYAQTGIGGITTPGVKGWIDNNISGLSSAGFAQNGATIDVVAPGDLNWALCSPDPAKYAACTNFADAPASVELEGGTSEAAPLTAGLAALVIQAYAKHHGGSRPSPALVKRIIVSTSENISAPGDQQGAGMIDAYQAVRAAASYHRSASGRTGHALLDSATQLNAVGQPGSTQHFTETLSNDGASKVTVGLSTRTLSPYRAVSTKSLTLTAAKDLGTTVTFHVAKGQARLNASVALKGVVNLSLISPNGDLAEYNLPQGQGNYGNAQVADPAPGTWTAVISAESDAKTVHAKFQASTATWWHLGTLSKSSLTLAAGASKSFGLTVVTPARAGDKSGSIIVRSSAQAPAFAKVTSIPVTLRSLIPTPDPSTTVTGTLTGGNGRSASTGQSAYYQVAVPAGLKELNVEVSTASSANPLFATLINPRTGDPVSAAASGLSTGTSKITAEDGAQLHVVRPTAGLWTLVVDFYGTVSGTAISQPFTIKMNDTQVHATAAGLPDSASSQLASGTPVTVPVKITNNGTTPEAYFVDARLHSEVKENLAAQVASSLTLPNLAGVVPSYLVPSHTTTLATSVSSSANLYYDYSWPFGDPDLISSTGKTATGTYSASQVAPGDWTITPFLQGPTGATQAKNVTATISVRATTAAFDPAVTSTAGDLWLRSTNTGAPFAPIVAQPGETITIPVTITPSGSSGQQVSGTLYIADYQLISGAATYNGIPGDYQQASDVAAFPYKYTIK